MKDLLTLDFETLYGDDYTLSKLTTEAYIRDARFEAIMMGYKLGSDPCHYVVGKDKIQDLLDNLDVENRPVLCHHAHFDGLILSHHFGHTPKVWFDTLSMARALHGSEVGNSLAKLMLHYGVGEKGTEIIMAKGKRLRDFSPGELAAYGGYCMKDVQGTYDIFNLMLPSFNKSELKIIDMVTRMFTEPALLLDEELLQEYAQELQANKLTLLTEAGVTLDEVMSNEKFAAALQRAGIEFPPTKTSLTTGKQAWAFAKTDKGLLELAEHPSDQVQALVAARLGNKSTINETRARSMAAMAPRGPTPIYLKYSGAQQTHRLSGGDSMNWQNLGRGGALRKAIYASDGWAIMVVDSKNIEARVLDWLALQEDAVQSYREFDAGQGPDIYCVMASKIYKRPITPEDKQERFLGKVVKLACGYQMGAERFRETARNLGLVIDANTAATGVNLYRETHGQVKLLWNRGQNALGSLMGGPDGEKFLDPHNLLEIEQGAIVLPNGLKIRYPELSFDTATKWSFRSNRGERTNLYGGKVIENVVQALARIIVLEQTLEIHKQIPCRMSVHDEGVFLVPEENATEWLEYAKGVMSKPPSWAPDLPVAASGGIAARYGDVDK